MIEILSAASVPPFSPEWYETSSAGHFWFEWRFRAACRQMADVGLSMVERMRALDVGCGNGILRDQIEAATAWTVDCAELNREALAQCAPGRGRLLVYDVLEERAEMRGRYDVVLLFDVIEHVEDAQRFMGAAFAHLKIGGTLLVNVPALQSFYSEYDRALGHFRRYDRPSLSSLLSGLPHEIRDMRYWGFSMLPLLAMRRWLGRGENDREIVKRGMVPPLHVTNQGLKVVARAETALGGRPFVGTSLLLAACRIS
jgi:SAM-dependent methyltransferase